VYASAECGRTTIREDSLISSFKGVFTSAASTAATGTLGLEGITTMLAFTTRIAGSTKAEALGIGLLVGSHRHDANS
jgi:hypothetical protein